MITIFIFLLGVATGVLFKKYILNAAEEALKKVVQEQKEENAKLDKFNNELIEKVDDLEDQLHFKNSDKEFVEKQLEISKRDNIRLKQELEKAVCDCDKAGDKADKKQDKGILKKKETNNKPQTKRRGRPRKKDNNKSK